jgi:predicted RNA-binding protein with PUA-like domain
MQYWLMKTEPDVFSIDTLKQKKVAPWDGVRNYQARNHMRAMQVGDQVLFYHSSADPSGVAGLAEIARTAYPDHTSWDPKSDYFDPKSTPEKPLWDMVDVRYVKTLKNFLPLGELKQISALADMVLFQRSRLSVQPVEKKHYDLIVKLGGG